MRRLELRLLLEPGIARLAAERATPADIAALRESIEIEAAATDADTAHDASRRSTCASPAPRTTRTS